MKKAISVLTTIVIIINLFAFSAFAGSQTLRYSVDFAPNGVYYSDVDKTMKITGWAFDESGERVNCFYVIDSGASVFTDPVVRNDVKSVFPECSQLDCGFDQSINLEGISAGAHTFKFYAKRGSENTLLSQTEFEVRKIIKDCNTIPSGEYNAGEISVLNVWGWAFSSWGDNTDCFYQIDENSPVLLDKTKRSDVAAAYDICLQEYCGFNTNIPVSEFTIGEHELTLLAVCGEVQAVIAKASVIITSGSTDIKYGNDRYLSGEYNADVTESVQISGWAFDKNANEVRCAYQIDNNPRIMLDKITRNDVYNIFEQCTQLDCGYNYRIPLAGLAKGAHTYRLYTICAGAVQIIKETQFIITGSEGEIKLRFDFAPDKSYNLGEQSYVLVQGWGYDTSATAVKFYGRFDGGDEFYLTPDSRKDVYNAFDDCYTLDCGYRQSIYIGNLSSGAHTFTITAKSAINSKTVSSSFSVTRPDYTVSFNLAGGSGTFEPINKKFAQNKALPLTQPTRQYYEFHGWNTNPDGSGKSYNPGEEYRDNTNAVLYAVWERDSFRIKDDSEISVDAKNSLIYGIEPESSDSAAVISCFDNTNIVIDGDKAVTGTLISLRDSGNDYKAAKAVILGDTDSDGKTDARDSIIAACIAEGMLDADCAVFNAADCAHDGQIDSSDINLMNEAGLLKTEIDQHSVPSRDFYDTEFDIVSSAEPAYDSVMINGKPSGAQTEAAETSVIFTLNKECDLFNYFGIKYTSSCHVKGTIEYGSGSLSGNENFFLEPAESKKDFYSFIDGVFDSVRKDRIVSVRFEPIDEDEFDFELYGISLFNRAVPDKISYISNGSIKIGVNLDWGGALSYYEDLDSGVQAVSDNGIIRIDSNAAQRYDAEVLSGSVNLINCHDAGRLVQQSYYGTENYDMGFFNGHYCAYNPVQGGNMYNDSSKIVDVRADGNSLYVKCRPLDWAKEKEYITDSYMEATYTICGNTLKTQCRFVDFSGYDPAQTGQELPAFYSAATLGRFVYYGGSDPWSGGELSEATGLDEYLYAHYPTFSAAENWGALTGEFDDSFSIGMYIPDVSLIAAGVYGSITDQDENPDMSNSTSYLSGVRSMLFRSFEPIEYDFYITTGTVNEVRETFRSIANQ